jgi:hypothetical protein
LKNLEEYEFLKDRIYSHMLFNILRHDIDQILSARTELMANIRDEINYKVDALEKQVDRRFMASEAAIVRSNEALTHRLEGMNEVRDQLREQAGTFVRRELVDQRFDLLENEINNLKSDKASADAVQTYRRWLLGIAVATGVTFFGVAIELLKSFPHA